MRNLEQLGWPWRPNKQAPRDETIFTFWLNANTDLFDAASHEDIDEIEMQPPNADKVIEHLVAQAHAFAEHSNDTLRAVRSITRILRLCVSRVRWKFGVGGWVRVALVGDGELEGSEISRDR